MVLDGAIKAPSLIRFLERLVRGAGRKVFLILDRLQVHRAGLVRAWLDGRQDQIEVFYLPAYSPDLNPDEGLNGDVKQAVTASSNSNWPDRCTDIIVRVEPRHGAAVLRRSGSA